MEIQKKPSFQSSPRSVDPLFYGAQRQFRSCGLIPQEILFQSNLFILQDHGTKNHTCIIAFTCLYPFAISAREEKAPSSFSTLVYQLTNSACFIPNKPESEEANMIVSGHMTLAEVLIAVGCLFYACVLLLNPILIKKEACWTVHQN